MTKTKKLHHITKLRLALVKPLKVTGWFLLTMIGLYTPCYLAQLYESNIYLDSNGHLTKFQAAHYSNMISFGYQVAAFATVVLGYCLIKKVYDALKAPNPLKQLNDNSKAKIANNSKLKQKVAKLANVEGYKAVGKEFDKIKKDHQNKKQSKKPN